MRTTQAYSTSFSLGIRFLGPELREAIYAIYGFVRFADEIVDTFHDHDKAHLFARFKADTYEALDVRISLNPILHAFQRTYHTYGLEREHVDLFLRSMEWDLNRLRYDRADYDAYIVGSAEVVGLMCLKVFVHGDEAQYQRLKPAAMKLGAAFQKVNFLRDLKDDHQSLGRTYFPGIDLGDWGEDTKRAIEDDIQADFDAALEGIRQLPKGARFGVYMAYIYYVNLFRKIKALPANRIMQERVRVRNRRKIALLTTSYLRHSFGML